jgi:tRNA A37 threonylcarbamoyladenosine modification protein TsaB
MTHGIILETGGKEGFVALTKNNQILESIPLSSGPLLSKTMAQQLDLLLKKHAIKHPDYIAAGKGPGTFTGIRVGAALAKALAYGWQIPLISYETPLTPNPEILAIDIHQSFLTLTFDPHLPLTYSPPIFSPLEGKTAGSYND